MPDMEQQKNPPITVTTMEMSLVEAMTVGAFSEDALSEEDARGGSVPSDFFGDSHG